MPDTRPLSELQTSGDRGSIKSPWEGVRPGFRSRIIAGIVFFVPLVIAAWVSVWIYNKIYGLSKLWFGKLYQQSAAGHGQTISVHALEALGVLLTLAMLLLLLWIVGSLSSSIIVRIILRMFERIVRAVPVVRSAYNFSKQIVELMGHDQRANFKRVALIEFPRTGCWAIAFVTGDTLLPGSPHPHVALFVPTTPHLTCGYTVVLPKADVREIAMTVEAALGIIVSGGITVPPQMDLAIPAAITSAERTV